MIGGVVTVCVCVTDGSPVVDLPDMYMLNEEPTMESR